ncbi:MAG: hypothetical protein GY696_13385 [Gammaproteobacteria bacterium]|nr:hypothetical protein [Gammaproteobacteria bacterium]
MDKAQDGGNAGNLRKIPTPALPRLREELGEVKDVADWVNQFDDYGTRTAWKATNHNAPVGGSGEEYTSHISSMGKERFRTFSRTLELMQRNNAPHQQYGRQVVDFFWSASSRAKARIDFNRRNREHGESVRSTSLH